LTNNIIIIKNNNFALTLCPLIIRFRLCGTHYNNFAY